MQIEVSVKKPTRGLRLLAVAVGPGGGLACSQIGHARPRVQVPRALTALRDDAGSRRPRGRRPGRMSQVSGLRPPGCGRSGRGRAGTGRSRNRRSSARASPSGTEGRPGGRARPCTVSGRDPFGDEDARLDRRPGGDDRRPAAVRQAALRGQLGADLAEERRLQLGQVRDRSGSSRRRCGARSAGRSSARTGYRRSGCRRRVVRVLRPANCWRRGFDALPVQRVRERRLVRLVVRRQRPVLEALRDEQPAAPVGLHDERVVAADRVRAFAPSGGT